MDIETKFSEQITTVKTPLGESSVKFNEKKTLIQMKNAWDKGVANTEWIKNDGSSFHTIDLACAVSEQYNIPVDLTLGYPNPWQVNKNLRIFPHQKNYDIYAIYINEPYYTLNEKHDNTKHYECHQNGNSIIGVFMTESTYIDFLSTIPYIQGKLDSLGILEACYSIAQQYNIPVHLIPPLEPNKYYLIPNNTDFANILQEQKKESQIQWNDGIFEYKDNGVIYKGRYGHINQQHKGAIKIQQISPRKADYIKTLQELSNKQNADQPIYYHDRIKQQILLFKNGIKITLSEIHSK